MLESVTARGKCYKMYVSDNTL